MYLLGIHEKISCGTEFHVMDMFSREHPIRKWEHAVCTMSFNPVLNDCLLLQVCGAPIRIYSRNVRRCITYHRNSLWNFFHNGDAINR